MSHSPTPTDRADLVAILEARAYVQAALVFGSVARGDAGPDSDLDIAILSAAPLSAEQHLDLMHALALHSGRPVDLIDLAAHQGPIVRHAFTRGELVFCRDQNAYAARMGKMLRDQADFEPSLLQADQQAIRKWLKPKSSTQKSAA